VGAAVEAQCQKKKAFFALYLT